MLVIKNGDILNATENLICHQVNENGIMGGGLALQIATKYPDVEEQYKSFCKQCEGLLYGQYQACKVGDKKYICNCFTQQDFVTKVDLLELVFRGLLETCKLNGFSIAIPYKYGCGIATGDWDIVSKTFQSLSEEYEVDISVYKLEGMI